jgi:4-amino-4-deoxychorismate lyase
MKNEFLETIKILDGDIAHLEYHQQRYQSVLKHFNADGFKQLHKFIKAPKKGLFRCRVLYTPDNIDDIFVEYIPYEKREIKTLKIVYDDTIDYRFKSTNREDINRLFMMRGDCDDILIVKEGFITDTSIANIALYDGIWKTPKHPLLKGTTRQRLLDNGELTEEDIRVEDLASFSKVALLNSMIGFDIIANENKKDVFC